MTDTLIERQDLLIAALRSGEYSQCEGRLKKSNSFCCLGVASDIYAKETGKADWVTEDGSYEIFAVNGVRWNFQGSIDGLLSSSNLINDVKDWFGFNNPAGYINGELVDGHDGINSLMGINDSGKDFKFIADVIELRRKDIFVE